jgi:hypothetical protein
MEKACEAASSSKSKHDEYSLRNKYFPYIESFLPKTEHLLFQHIAKYEDKNSKLLNTPYPLDVITFSIKGPDSDIVYKCTQINQQELINDMDKVPKAKSAIENASFTPLQVVLLMIIRYYMITKQKSKLKAVYYYYGYSIYWSIYGQFLKKYGYAPREETMIYTINELTYKNILKKLGSVKEWIGYNVQTPIENDSSYERLADCRNEDIRRTLEAIIVNMRSKIREVSSKYYENDEKGNVMMVSRADLDDQGAQRLDVSVTTEADKLAQEFTGRFFMADVNMNTIKRATTLAKDASPKEIKVTLEEIKNKVPIEEVSLFYSSLFYLFLASDDPKATTANAKTFKFFMVMKDMFKKGNSTDINIVRVRELMDKWLERGSNTYRITNREATKTGYRRAIYYYFILSVSER